MKEISPTQFKICADKRLAEYLRDQDAKLEAQIDQESDDYIGNVDEDAYLEHLVGENCLDTPHLDFDNITASTNKKLVPAEDFPYGQFHVRKGQSYEKGLVVFHIPYNGDIDLLRYYSDNYYVDNGPIGYAQDGCLCFEIIDFYDDLARVKKRSQSIINNIKSLVSKVIGEIENHNYALEWKIRRRIEERKRKIKNIVQVLGVPIRKRENLSRSYDVPASISRKTISLKPQAATHGGRIEYSLDDALYLDILNVINDYGKVFEQYPSTYKNKREEELRDHFLLILQPRYKGAATGETFNKVGRTDILIKHENTTVFIAECKFWHGQKGYVAALSQLLNYLTWRNSKAAVVLFVRNKDFSSVLDEVKATTPAHSNFVRHVDEHDEAWINYVFHLNDNPDREVKLAVLLFHIPSMVGDLSDA